MIRRTVVTIVLMMAMMFVCVPFAYAAVSQETIDAIIEDAKDGTLDGDWTKEEVRAAIEHEQQDPSSVQYEDIPPVMEEYVNSPIPTDQEGELAYTGAPLVFLLLGGAVMVVGGWWLRRKHRK